MTTRTVLSHTALAAALIALAGTPAGAASLSKTTTSTTGADNFNPVQVKDTQTTTYELTISGSSGESVGEIGARIASAPASSTPTPSGSFASLRPFG